MPIRITGENIVAFKNSDDSTFGDALASKASLLQVCVVETIDFHASWVARISQLIDYGSTQIPQEERHHAGIHSEITYGKCYFLIIE